MENEKFTIKKITKQVKKHNTMSESEQVQWTDAWISANVVDRGISDTILNIYVWKFKKNKNCRESIILGGKTQSPSFMDSRTKAG